MWREKDLLGQIQDYFKNITEEEFLKDLESAGCLDMIEEVPIQTSINTIINYEENSVGTVSYNERILVNYPSLSMSFTMKNSVVKEDKFNFDQLVVDLNLQIGA